MADHSKPLTSSTYANFVTELDSRIDDVTAALDPAYTSPTNLVTNAVRFSSAAAKWQRWTGSAWVDLAASNNYAIDISGNAGTVNNGVVTTGSYANPAWITSLAGTKVSGNIAGNAGTATALATARNINGTAFDGTAAITVNTNTNLTFNNGGSGAASGATFNGGTATTISYNTVGAPSTTGATASGTWGININGTVGATTVNTGAFSTISASGVITSTVAIGTAPFTVTSTTEVANLKAATATNATNAANLVTTGFSIVESGGKLYFKYGATNIASLDSSGNFIALANVTAYGTP